MTKKRRKRKFEMSLTSLIFIALLLGAVTGVLFHYVVPSGTVRDTVFINGIFYVVGQGFLRFMQMLVIPLVFCSLVCGSSAIGDTATLEKVGLKTVLFYMVTTAIAAAMSIVVGKLINPGIGLDISDIEKGEVTIGEKTRLADTLLNMVPKNPIASMANGDMLPIIVFALFVGIILAKMGERGKCVSSFFSQCNEMMLEMTTVIMKAAPIGVFCLIAKTFSGIGFSAFLPLLKYIGAVLFALLIHCFIVYMLLLRIFSGLKPAIFIKKFLPVMGFAFTTATSTATIPLSIETLEAEMGVSEKIASFTIPLGATINMDGTAIMQGVAVIFASQAYGIPLGIEQYLTVISTATLASVGTAGVPGVGLITLSMVFQSVGLPVEAIALIMGIDRIVDMARTAVNITGDAVCTTIVAKQSNMVDENVFYDVDKRYRVSYNFEDSDDEEK